MGLKKVYAQEFQLGIMYTYIHELVMEMIIFQKRSLFKCP